MLNASPLGHLCSMPTYPEVHESVDYAVWTVRCTYHQVPTVLVGQVEVDSIYCLHTDQLISTTALTLHYAIITPSREQRNEIHFHVNLSLITRTNKSVYVCSWDMFICTCNIGWPKMLGVVL